MSDAYDSYYRTPAEIERRLAEIAARLKEIGPSHVLNDELHEEFIALFDEQTRLNYQLDSLFSNQPPPPLEQIDLPVDRQGKLGYHRITIATPPKELIEKIDQLIDKPLGKTELDIELLHIAQETRRTTLDIRNLYYTRITELEEIDPENQKQLKTDLDQLLTIADQTLDLKEFLPLPLANPLTRQAQLMSLRPEVLLLALLAGISSCHKVGTELVIEEEMQFTVPPILYCGIVADSGQKKSPILRTLVKKPLDALERAVNEALKAKYEAELEDYRACTQEERNDRFPNGEPQQPDPIDYYLSDLTPAGIHRQFAKHPERGLLYFRDELSAMFKFDRFGKSTERQDFLSFYDGSGSKELRAEGFASRTTQTQLSILGAIQPELLRQLLQDGSDPDGLWARFLFVAQPQQKSSLRGQRTRYNINTELLNPLYRKVDALPRMTYYLSDAAFDLYANYYDRLEHLRCTSSDPGMQALYSKMEGTIGRLALNLHVIDEVLDQPEGVISKEIHQKHVKQAGKLVRFFINQAKRIRSTAVTAENHELAPHLAAIVERSRQVGSVSARDIKMSVWNLRKANPTDIRNHFLTLEKMGYGKCEQSLSRLRFCAKKEEKS